MRLWSIGWLAAVLVLVAAPARAQTFVPEAQTIGLKSGETATIGNVYWVINCRSYLTGTPKVEVLEGPPGLTATIQEAMVLPRQPNCPKKVSGGTLHVSVKEIEDPSLFPVTMRITYATKDGPRQRSVVLNVSLLP
jgi:hypothetical protein